VTSQGLAERSDRAVESMNLPMRKAAEERREPARAAAKEAPDSTWTIAGRYGTLADAVPLGYPIWAAWGCLSEVDLEEHCVCRSEGGS
jgi:hypothetical protein